jgi:ketosteroid isomerase-like protein
LGSSPASNVELVRAFFAGAPDDLAAAVSDPDWVARTREALAPLLTDDFEFVTVESVGRPATRPGVEGFFAAYAEYMAMWESATLLADRFVEVGDRVVVEATLSGITRTGGVRLEQAVAAVYTLEDGRIKRIEEFSDVASAHAAAAG